MIEEKIKELGFELPEAPKPLAVYTPALQIGDMVYTSGQVPIEKGELKYSERSDLILQLKKDKKPQRFVHLTD